MNRVVCILLASLLAACDNNSNNAQPEVSLPIADAGPNITLQHGATAVLNGSLSHDPEGNEITYSWSILNAPATSTSELVNPTSPFPSLYLDVVGDYEIALIVNNGEVSSIADTVKISDSDSTPTANAGSDIKLNGVQSVTLDGSRSHDSDGDTLSYQWTITSSPSGSSATLARATTPFPVFTPDVQGEYKIELIVNDGTLQSEPDYVTISDMNLMPTADAGLDKTINIGQEVRLDGSGSFDPEGDNLNFKWQIVSKPTNSNAILSNDSLIHPRITVDIAGDYVISLMVDDGQLQSHIDTVTLRHSDHLPIANAGLPQSIYLGESIQLDGSHSYDLDGDTLTPKWTISSKPKNSSIQLTDGSGFHPFFTPDLIGDYIIQLMVYDGSHFSSADAIRISVADNNVTPPNQTPIADAGIAQVVSAGQMVTLDGSASSDPDGDVLSYQWSLLNSPVGSTTALINSTEMAANFTPDTAGTYLLQLIVSDGEMTSKPSTVIITDTNLPPISKAGADQSVHHGNLVKLDGSASSDPEGQGISYRWTFLSTPIGSTANLTSPSSVTTEFTSDLAGDYIVQLTVTDNFGLNHSDVVVIRDSDSTTNTLPVANAGLDKLVDLGSSVTLDGTASSDADGDTLSYSWNMVSRPQGSSARLSDSTISTPNFTPDVDGDFVFQLVVSDGKSNSLPDTVVMHRTLKNLAPNAFISTPITGITNSVYNGLSGINSNDPNGDSLVYQWTLTPPSGSNTALNNAQSVNPTFTPDMAGSYLVTLSVSDGILTSSVVSQNIQVSDPAPGSALPLPAGHNLMALSTLGGSHGVGALYSVEESDLAKSTSIMELGGVPSFISDNTTQSLSTHPSNKKVYALITESGLYLNGAIIEYEPSTNTSRHFASIPRLTASNNLVTNFRAKITFHPDGKSGYAYSLNGGHNDAGVLIHINFDEMSDDYRKISVINEIGAPVTGYSGTSHSLITNLQWSGSNKLLATFGFSLHGAAPPALEFTASDPNNLSAAWVTTVYADGIWSRGRFIAYSQSNDALLYATLSSPPILELGNRNGGGGGYNIGDCNNPMGVFEWQSPQVFILCETTPNSHHPTLLSTNYTAQQPVLERSFSNLPDRDMVGITTSAAVDTLYMSLNDEFASNTLFLPDPSIYPIKAPTVYEIKPPNYATTSIITGGGDRGTYFVGDPAIVNDTSASVNDQYLSVLSFNGGKFGEGAILTHNKESGDTNVTDFGFEQGGFPYGRIHKGSDGGYYFSVGSSVGSIISGSTVRYDSALGTSVIFDSPAQIRTGISLVEHNSNKGTRLYGIGYNSWDQIYLVYSYDMATGQYEEVVKLQRTASLFPQNELSQDNGLLWALADELLYCIDPDESSSKIRGFYNFTTSGPHNPMRSVVFPVANNNGYIVTKESATSGVGSIVELNSGSCSNVTITDTGVSLNDQPVTGLVVGSNTELYFGTESGKLMKFDTMTKSVVEAASLPSGHQYVGYLIKDSNNELIGFSENSSTGEQLMVSYNLSSGALHTQAVPKHTPIDPIYPGFTEVN